jgi:hypothetical protein
VKRAALALLLSLAACVPQAVIDQTETEVAVHVGVLRLDAEAPLSAADWRRAYGASLDAWEAQRSALAGE